MVKFTDGLTLTPWHPVQISGEWAFPCDVEQAEFCTMKCDRVYSLLIKSVDFENTSVSNGVVKASQYATSVMINQTLCATLAHGIEDDPVVSHEFFGTNSVIKSLSRCHGWDSGRVILSAGWMVRDTLTSQVIDLNPKFSIDTCKGSE